MVPIASVGSSLAWIIFLIGLLFFSPFMMRIGIVLFSLAVLFTLLTLPVEIDASNRALKLLKSTVAMPEDELKAVKKVLTAAALTYVAATAIAILQLLRMLILAGIFGERR